jgi:hypothetical protein
MVQNIGRITIPYEKIPGTLEQGNLGLIRELNWEIGYCLARSFHWR